MGLQRIYRAAVGQRLALAVAFSAALLAAPVGHAETGTYAGMAGNWAGNGTLTLDDNSVERIRCRAVYQVAGPKMDMTLTCASDAYKLNLTASVVDQGGAIVGQWSETGRGITGSLTGRGTGGNFQLTAVTAGFNGNITLRTTGNKQSVSIRADSVFKAANISLSK